MVGLAVHTSLAVTSAFTLASLGKLPGAGLQPRSLPVGAPLIVGGVVSVVQEEEAVVRALFLPGLPPALLENFRVVTQPAVLSACVTVMVGLAVHTSLAVT